MTDRKFTPPKKQMHWANDYGTILWVGGWYDSRKDANYNASFDRIAVIRREQTGDKIEYYKEDV